MKLRFALILLAAWPLVTLAGPLPARPGYDQCLEALVARLLTDESHHVPHFVAVDRVERPEILVMSQAQKVVDRPDDIDAFKRDMLEERFRYESPEGRIGGHYHERRRVFFVGEGHHRLAAALEIAKESGDWRPFRRLIRHGLWEKTDRLPAARYRLPVRSTWGNYLSWRTFLGPLTPR